MESETIFVRVLYNFDYTTKETKLVSIRQGEKLQLLKQTNADWWQVKRCDSKPFYVPANYVREIPPPAYITLNNNNNKITEINNYNDINEDDEINEETQLRNKLSSTFRCELIQGNFKNNENNKKTIIKPKIKDKPIIIQQHGNNVNDKEKKVISYDNVSIITPLVNVKPSSATAKTRNCIPIKLRKPPVPVPRLKEFSKSLETLTEEYTNYGETSDYHTPSPDYLDQEDNSNMFWRKSSIQNHHLTPTNSTSSGVASDNSSVKKSNSFRLTRWPSRKKKRERKRSHLNGDGPSGLKSAKSVDELNSKSLELLIDSGAEACSSSSAEWDTPPAGEIPQFTTNKIPLAFRNYTYKSTDDEEYSDEEEEQQQDKNILLRRERSVSDTTPTNTKSCDNLLLLNQKNTNRNSRSESQIHFEDNSPRPLVALKRNQKVVGCRRRPALLCIPGNNSSRQRQIQDKEIYLPKAPRDPPSPGPHEKPLRVLPGGWAEFYCIDSGGSTGRLYYFNAVNGYKSWKPPRNRRPTDEDEGSTQEDGLRSYSRSISPSETISSCVVLPPGWEEHYDDEIEVPCYIHNSTGAKSTKKQQENLPNSVERWLKDLRHNTDSSETDEDLRLRVACDAVASEVEIISSPVNKKLTYENITPSTIRNKKESDVKTTLEEEGANKRSSKWEKNPIFKSITNEDILVETRGGGGSSFRSLCDEARRASQTLILDDNINDSSIVSCTSYHSALSNHNNNIQDIELDKELEKLSERALSLADEYIDECGPSSNITKVPVPLPRTLRRLSTQSQLSDDVFVVNNSSDINLIFDQGDTNKPIPPPRRKKLQQPLSDNNNSSTNNNNMTTTEKDKTITSGGFSVQIVDRKIYYPDTKKQDELTNIIPNELKALYLDEAEKIHTLNNESRLKKEEGSGNNDNDDVDNKIKEEEEMRSRKGSFSSDIIEWKKELLYQWDRLEYDEEDYELYKLPVQKSKWFSSTDAQGRIYYFEENSNESSWTLPNDGGITATKNKRNSKESSDETTATNELPRQGTVATRTAEAERRLARAAGMVNNEEGGGGGQCSPDNSPPQRRLPAGALLLPAYPGITRPSNKTLSMVIDNNNKRSSHIDDKTASIPRDWPQLFTAGNAVIKEGTLQKTKMMEGSKKVRKNWAPSHVVLTERSMLFFRDKKNFEAMRKGKLSEAKPELCIDLSTVALDIDNDKLSSRKNVFVINTTLGLQLLCQEDDMNSSKSWFHEIGLAMKNIGLDLGYGNNTTPRIKLPNPRESSPVVQSLIQSQLIQPESPNEDNKSGISRNKSLKNKKDVGSQEDLTAAGSPSADQTKIKSRLKKFFVRRPTMETLVKKGIYKDEPAFGQHLSKICPDTPGEIQVPIFVQSCIKVIESKPGNLKTDGLYRASGNLSQVQKIRLQVDANNFEVLEQEEDVHVLTGALKLFFRELKEPLIPFGAFNKAINAVSSNYNIDDKRKMFKQIIENLPRPNHDTLQYLLEHLLRVTEQQASNRMHIPNLAIVFGPTLMWPEEESINMALDCMQQNCVVETLLTEYKYIFKKSLLAIPN